MATVAVLGTGLLGTGFARNLLRKGHTVRVWNRSADKARALEAFGAAAAASPGEAVAGADRVHLVLAEDTAVDAVIEQIELNGAVKGLTIVDHSTNRPPAVAARVARLQAAGATYVHAPVFMNPKNAEDATGLMLIAGPDAIVATLRPSLEEMTGSLWHVGEAPDRAALLKLAGNGMLISLVGVMGDLYAMADAQGAPPSAIDELFQKFNPAGMVGYVGRRTAMGGAVPASFELTMARKDVHLMIEAAGGPEGLVALPAIREAMDRAIAGGQGSRDYAAYGWARKHGPR
jgi:3-hydroxyisobutyrate dehydrogenase